LVSAHHCKYIFSFSVEDQKIDYNLGLSQAGRKYVHVAIAPPREDIHLSTCRHLANAIKIWRLLSTGNLRPFASVSDFKDHWFTIFWGWFGPNMRENAAPKVMPLIQNNAHGICLDIGPGSGQWLYLFAKAVNPSITKIYGVEPNVGLHPELRANAEKAGLGDVYEVIGCGAQELGTKGGLQTESVDTVITVQCLCSIPTPEKIIKELYPFLKPGGKWLVYEHVRTKYQDHFVGPWQREFSPLNVYFETRIADACAGAVNVIWPHFFNGCNITRPTDEWLLQAGEWEDVSLRPNVGEGCYDTIPHVQGTLTKRR
jgi:SAM-dependent methyltransferase